MPIEQTIRRQAGVISRAQALSAGLSEARLKRLVAVRSWVRMHPQVYLVTDHELTWEARLRAAMLWAGPTATLSRLCAAWWHGLVRDPPAMIDLTVPQRWKRSTQPGLRVRRRDLLQLDRIKVNGVWITGVPLTVLEAAVKLRASGAELLDRALQRRVTFDELCQAHTRNLGRHGSVISTEQLRTCADRAVSHAERVAVALLRAAGIRGWECGYRIEGYVADIAFPDSRLVIEVDGWAWHSDVVRFQHDRRRQNAIVLAGWRVLRFTWRDLTSRPDGVVAEVRTALARAG